MAKKVEYNEASTQAWPSFVDILSSTIVVLCFALLIVVIVLSVSTVSSSLGENANESSPSEVRLQSDILGEYRAEFQKVLVITNPSLRREMNIESEEPNTENPERPLFAPVPSQTVENPQEVQEPGQSEREVLGDLPREIVSRSTEVLEELIIVQRDVIEQQRKVIEQQNQEVEDTVREYQSLLALTTREREVEDIRQQIIPRENIAKFIDVPEGEQLAGPEEVPNGNSRYALDSAQQPNSVVTITPEQNSLKVSFKDNSPFLLEDSYNQLKATLSQIFASIENNNFVLEATISDFAVSQAEGQRVAVDRLLIIRSILVELGVKPSAIRLRTLQNSDNDQIDNSMQEGNYGSVTIREEN